MSRTSAPADGRPIRVFISYSHDSQAHAERVLALSERLRADGIETMLDQYVNGSPPEGWPRWMLNRIDESDVVPLVCTETYYRRFYGEEGSDKDPVADLVAATVTQEVYDSVGRTGRVIPVLFALADRQWIPEPLRGLTSYALDSEAGYGALHEDLLRWSGLASGAISARRRSPRAPAEPLNSGSALSVTVRKLAERLNIFRREPAKTADPALKSSRERQIAQAVEKLRTMSATDPAETFDCFLSHNSEDKPLARALAQALRVWGFSVWIDEERMRRGSAELRLLESAIRASRSVVVLIGPSRFRRWQDAEAYEALRLASDDGRPVIPVLLPDGPASSDLPFWLQRRTAVVLHRGSGYPGAANVYPLS